MSSTQGRVLRIGLWAVATRTFAIASPLNVKYLEDNVNKSPIIWLNEMEPSRFCCYRNTPASNQLGQLGAKEGAASNRLEPIKVAGKLAKVRLDVGVDGSGAQVMALMRTEWRKSS